MKHVVLFLGLATLLATAAFAGGQQQNTGATAAVKYPPVTILINQSPWLAGFETMAALYSKETGNSVKVEPVPFSAIIPKSMNATSAPQSEYSILTLGEQMYVPFFAGGLVAPLDKIDPGFKLPPQVIQYNYVDRWNAAQQTSDKQGKLYGVPINGNIQILFYRKDLFAAHHLTPPKTWAEVAADAKILSNPPKMYGYVMRDSISEDWMFQAFLYGYGGSVAHRDPATGKWTVDFDTPAARTALQKYLYFLKTFSPPNWRSLSQAELISLMATGHAAMIPTTVAAQSVLNDPKQSLEVGKIGATVIPGETAQTRSPISGMWLQSIPNNLPMTQKKAALAFLAWAITKKAQLAYVKAGSIPVRQDVYTELAQSNNPDYFWAKAMAESTAFIHPIMVRSTAAATVIEIMDRTLGETIAGQLTADQALSQMETESQAALNSAK